HPELVLFINDRLSAPPDLVNVLPGLAAAGRSQSSRQTLKLRQHDILMVVELPENVADASFVLVEVCQRLGEPSGLFPLAALKRSLGGLPCGDRFFGQSAGL